MDAGYYTGFVSGITDDTVTVDLESDTGGEFTCVVSRSRIPTKEARRLVCGATVRVNKNASWATIQIGPPGSRGGTLGKVPTTVYTFVKAMEMGTTYRVPSNCVAESLTHYARNRFNYCLVVLSPRLVKRVCPTCRK